MPLTLANCLSFDKWKDLWLALICLTIESNAITGPDSTIVRAPAPDMRVVGSKQHPVIIHVHLMQCAKVKGTFLNAP